MSASSSADGGARRRIREDLDATLFVEAAAGTGKTTALVSRIVALLCSGGARLEQIVALTFTEKAAGELKLRLREGIERARSDEASPEAGARLDAALEQLELARIGTIHSFCGDLLRERPVEAGVDPLFAVAAEDEARGLLDAAFDAWFERVLADPPEGVRRVLRRRASREEDGGPRAMLRRAVENLVEHRDFEAAWRRDPFGREAAIDELMESLADAASLAERARRRDDYLAQSFRAIARFVDDMALLESVRGRDHDGLEAALRALASGRNRHWRWTGGKRPYAADLSREDALAARDGVKRSLDALLAACDADLAPLLREELRDVVAAYETLKQRAGRLDFLDLLLRARNLIRENAAVRHDFQRRYTHFFVDEFQDTDPLQVEILLLLAAGDPAETDWQQVRPLAGKLFLVGDPKQSIYRFRRADVALYEQVKRQLLSRGAELLELTASFRALPSLQRFVNAAFAPVMQGSEDGSQAGYVALEPVREETAERPSLVVLPVPRPYTDYGDRAVITRARIEGSFPDAVAAFVDWLVGKSGWSIEEPGRGRLPVAPRHVCILLRRFQSFESDMTRPYVRALEARRIPHVMVGGRSFHEREEVLALRNALTAIEWPEDELRVFATLRGPFFALADDALLAFRAEHKSLHSLRWIDPERSGAFRGDARDVADALAILGRLHRDRNRVPIAQTLQRLLREVRAHAGLAIWPTGEQALANCLRALDLARRFERHGASSFRAFVEFMEQEIERGRSEDAPVVEEGSEGVRIMTVHRAKGLEFPVVILADPTCHATSTKPSRHVDPRRRLWAEPLCGCVPPELRDAEADERRRDGDEALRVAYVAATRARDLLVLPAVGDLAPDHELARSWLEVMNARIYPAREARRASEPAPGCPAFGEDSVFERPASSGLGAGASVKPGLHAAPERVVWWDPAALTLDVQEEVGLRQQRILAADERGAAEESVKAHESWQAERATTLERGSLPSYRVESVGELAERGAPVPDELAGPAIRLEEVSLDRSARPGGARFGVLVHATLAAVDLEAGQDAIAELAELHGRLVGASEAEVRAAAVAVRAALRHPLLRSAARASRRGELRRETPVLVRLADGSLVEGVLDLAFREESASGPRWTVVDFKTDHELSLRRARYEAQVRLYAMAVARATGESASGVLLRV